MQEYRKICAAVNKGYVIFSFHSQSTQFCAEHERNRFLPRELSSVNFWVKKMPETLVTSPEYKHRIEEKSPLGEKFKGNDFLKEDVKEKDKDCLCMKAKSSSLSEDLCAAPFFIPGEQWPYQRGIGQNEFCLILGTLQSTVRWGS